MTARASDSTVIKLNGCYIDLEKHLSICKSPSKRALVKK